ncbi:hypothetical protein [Bailinhaonella thermotolerans]|uniref:DUF2029 domain-containing protein n=1 Tax=Bailinhaonella thermotolerans TaxID=1070861 RepID=A0A3A4B6I1_9ACTN|nr:hypothetical protein [Bailinhaonella thermotolerans]RJL33134.1 hypothetical protein D5H75_09785 [Bailinhaonella thermotolerans]
MAVATETTGTAHDPPGAGPGGSGTVRERPGAAPGRAGEGLAGEPGRGGEPGGAGGTGRRGEPGERRGGALAAWLAVAALVAGVLAMAAAGLAGPSAAVPSLTVPSSPLTQRDVRDAARSPAEAAVLLEQAGDIPVRRPPQRPPRVEHGSPGAGLPAVRHAAGLAARALGVTRGELVTGVLWAGLITGTGGLLLGLRAVRRGARPPGLVALGVAGAVSLALVPPLASTDLLDYAVYGRMAALGLDPGALTPVHLMAGGDPVAAFASVPWRAHPSVYGPLATATQWLAAELGGGSLPRTVLLLKLTYTAMFLLTALVLARLAPGPRVHLLWTANPLMLWAVPAGGHLDVAGALLLVLALLALSRRRAPAAGALTAGGLLAGAVAVKATFGLAVPALALGARRLRPGAAVALVAGGGAAAAYLLGAPGVPGALAARSGEPTTASVWSLPPEGSYGVPALIAALALAALLAWRLPPADPSVRLALAFALAFLCTATVYRPWYDVLVFPLLGLVPASAFDGLVAVRSLVAALAYVPGWVTAEAVVPPVVPEVVIPALLAALTAALAARCLCPPYGMGVVAVRRVGGRGRRREK